MELLVVVGGAFGAIREHQMQLTVDRHHLIPHTEPLQPVWLERLFIEVFLGRIAGSVIKRTEIPVLVAPLDKSFSPPERMLLAFKTGEVKASSTISPLASIQEKFKSKLKLLLVKVPGFANRNHQLNDELMQRSDQLLYSENATVYQGVLEHFQANKPDLLVAFKRGRGFFEKLWEPDLIYKKDFYCTVPLLVLKNKN